MSLPEFRRSRNVKLTFQKVIPNPLPVATVTTAGVARNIQVPVHYNDRHADPDAEGNPTHPEAEWIAIYWLAERAGKGGSHQVQIDVYKRIGAQNDPNGDPFGRVVDDIADTIEGLFSGRHNDGRYKWELDILDFTDPRTPIAVGDGGCLIVMNRSAPGAHGCPTDRRQMPDDKYQRVVLTYEMSVITDLVRGNTYVD
jgi:hypothetical protein